MIFHSQLEMLVVLYFLRHDPPPPFEAILVIFGRSALICFLFESSWKKLKNNATFVLMRSGDHLGDAEMSKKGTSLCHSVLEAERLFDKG